MTIEIETVKTIEIGATQSPVNTNVRDESFYLERFKRALNDRGYVNGRVVDTDFHCEIYKGFAIVTWQQEWRTPQGVTRNTFNTYVWEVGGVFDHLENLGWIAQGCVTTGFNATTNEQALKKVKKRVDLYFKSEISEKKSHKD